MKPYIRITFVLLIILGVAACAPVTPAVLESTPTTQPVSSEPYYPLSTRTGIETVDRVLNAVESGDPQALRAQVEFLTAPCTKQEGFGGPPKCREEEAEGTPVEGLAFISSEGGIIRKDEIENWTGVDAAGVYAVYEVNAAAVSSEQYYPIGKYVILLVRGENEPAVALRIGESGIVRVDDVFDFSPEALRAKVEAEALNVLLPPKT